MNPNLSNSRVCAFTQAFRLSQEKPAWKKELRGSGGGKGLGEMRGRSWSYTAWLLVNATEGCPPVCSHLSMTGLLGKRVSRSRTCPEEMSFRGLQRTSSPESNLRKPGRESKHWGCFGWNTDACCRSGDCRGTGDYLGWRQGGYGRIPSPPPSRP